jgi:small subunit ribosomal protein S24e
MEIINRKENPLLNRVELSFRWEHSSDATPTLAEMVAAAAQAEPGAKVDLVFVKNVNTRYGRPQTTGLALIYGAASAAKVEPEFIHSRHKSIHASSTPAEPIPVTVKEVKEVEPAAGIEATKGADES